MKLVRWTAALVLAALVAASASSAPPGDGGAPKIRFEFLVLPDQLLVSTERTLSVCLVNKGDDGELRRGGSDDDRLVLSIPLGDLDEHLVAVADAGALACAGAPPRWECTLALAADVLHVTFRPSGASVEVASHESTCFDLTGVRVNAASGLAFNEMEQLVSPARAEEPENTLLPAFKSLAGTVQHDDLGGVRDDQHDNPYTLFSKVGGTATDDQVPDDVTIEHAQHAGDLDCGGCVETTEIADGSILDADVSASASIAGTKVRPRFGAQDVTTLASLGVGTETPGARLNVRGGALRLDTVAGTPTVTLDSTFGAGLANGWMQLQAPTSSGVLARADAGDRAAILTLGGSSGTTITLDAAWDATLPIFLAPRGGVIRLTNTALETVTINGGGIFLPPFSGATGGRIVVRNGNGDATIELDGDDDDGAGRVTTGVLEITGGADVAEPFDVAGGDVEPGMVVVIDPDRPGLLKLADAPADRAVAGVVSGANGLSPGLVLKHARGGADGSHPVALTGRVWTWCDADAGGAIRPGDLLTTAARPGHAMRVREPSEAHGAVLGKAMSSLESGRGLVLVLVSLQ